MPRQRGGGGARGGGRPAAPARRGAAPAGTQSRAPPPADRRKDTGGGGGGLMGAMMGSAVQGLGFGTGSAMAHRAVDSMFGPREVEHKQAPDSSTPQQQTSASPQAAGTGQQSGCEKQMRDFNEVRSHSSPAQQIDIRNQSHCVILSFHADLNCLSPQCLESSNGELAQCQFYYDLLQQCRRG